MLDTLKVKPAQTLAMSESEAVVGRPSVKAPFSLGMMKAAETHTGLCLLTADLGKYTDTADFRMRHPDRFFNVGMAEQALVTAAAGLSKVGKVAYCTTYGTFATRRAYDFLAIACAHSNENVKMFAGNPGLTTGYGGTHQATEDLALMLSIPNMTVIDPCDATEMQQIAEQAVDWPGTMYCRLLRANVAQVFDPATHRFQLGKGHVIGDSGADVDVGFVSTGFMTERAIDTAEHLRQRGVSASVFHSATIKPFDKEGLLAFAASAKRIVVVENHVAIGGLATLVIDALFEAGLSRKLLKIAIPDQFIECGSLPYLQDRYGLTTPRICERVAAWLQ
ncbi:transketolase family protein [Variovorax sp. HJSM1_2]|uniref:transketolase family protein n=1 Tax=Variovorax sp. HJSM1_2 TaxID=3366263 RepID=UPI003BC62EB6